MDKFYGEDVSYYMISDLVQLTDEELKELFDYSEEECRNLRQTQTAIESPEDYTDAELMALGIREEDIKALREQN